jgi:DNA-directed RNA polymerase specialized sigma24 family protein
VLAYRGAVVKNSAVSSWVDGALPRVYQAALGAAADERAAHEATVCVFAALRGERPSPESLAARAVRVAVRTHPQPAFAAMDLPAREAVALARLLEWSLDAIADELAVERAQVKTLLDRGLRATRRLLATGA